MSIVFAMKNPLVKVFGVAAVVAVIGVGVFICVSVPRTRDLGNGYMYIYFPRGGHRYIVAQPEGIKRVGQEVLDYQVNGNVITGRVRVALGGNDIRTFSLNTTSHVVTLAPPLDRPH
jgi:hypothetical protein